MTGAETGRATPPAAIVRILRAFGERTGRVDVDAIRFDTGGLRVLPLAATTRAALLAGPWLVRLAGGGAALSQAGRAAIADPARQPARAPAAAGPSPRRGEAGRLDGPTRPLDNPLAWLATRRDRDGTAFLSPAAIEAGERLQRDHELGQAIPGLVSNWRSNGRVDGGGGGDGGGLEDQAARVRAARLRVERALEAVGADLGGVLVEVCCLSKGLEQLEQDRGWPARSAKVVVRLALDRLAEHYDQPRRKRVPIVHWGSLDYRPTHQAARPRATD